jgi:chaperonin GroEL (HSP60 family)
MNVMGAKGLASVLTSSIGPAGNCKMFVTPNLANPSISPQLTLP